MVPRPYVTTPRCAATQPYFTVMWILPCFTSRSSATTGISAPPVEHLQPNDSSNLFASRCPGKGQVRCAQLADGVGDPDAHRVVLEAQVLRPNHAISSLVRAVAATRGKRRGGTLSQHSSCMEAEGSAPMKLRVSFHVGLRSFETTVVCFSAPPTCTRPDARGQCTSRQSQSNTGASRSDRFRQKEGKTVSRGRRRVGP